VPAGTPFADALARGLLDGHGGDPAALADTLVLVPNRRAARALGEAFLRASDGKALVLPRMAPIGDVDEAELMLSGADLDLPPAISGLPRRLHLARLVAHWHRARDRETPDMAQAARLAEALAAFIDEIAIERLDHKALRGLVREDLAEHWKITLDFLEIVTGSWPAMLADLGRLDPADRRNRLLEAQTDTWRKSPPAFPVIAAGSTGSLPATADLLAVVARLPRGEVVFPGLDLSLDDESWGLLEPTHPQWAMKQTLERMRATRDDVRHWPGTPDEPSPRARLLSEAMRPAPTTGRWRDAEDRVDLDAALDGLAWVEARSAPEEAQAIALLMRETLEVPGRTAALVTHDRGLARRVAAELGRWGVEVDDSAGRPLSTTPPGAFLRLLAEAVADGLAPVPLLALLKHPLAAGGMEPVRFRTLARRLERAVLRGPRPGPGLAGLEAALEAAMAGDKGERLEPLVAWLDRLRRILAPLLAESARADATLPRLVEAHVAAAEALAATEEEPGQARLWAGDAGQAAADFVAELVEAGDALGPFAGRSFPGLLDALMAGVAVRPRFGAHPRLHIWGPLEARLQQADLVILGGLNEGTWPPAIPADPWLSRPMRDRFGLAPLERRTGLSAHDFAQAAAAPRVVLSRAAKVDGTPTVPSRWLLRLETLLGEGRRAAAPALGWTAALDPPMGAPVGPPAPRPPLAARPRVLSVSDVERLRRDPYALYARRILRLAPLDPLDADPGAAERGTFIHAALESFLREMDGERFGDDALDRLLAHGRRAFGPALARPSVAAFWWPRFEAVARWFVTIQAERRHRGIVPVALEVEGRLVIQAPGGPFTLTARADRIDREAGGLVIIDYKTGAPPGAKEIKAGYSPQLPLEALIAEAGGFTGVPAAPVSELAFWRLSGGDPAGEEVFIRADLDELKEGARGGLAALVAHFDDPDTPYFSRPRPKFVKYGEYDHLARVAEWAGAGGEE
jgi:ATP-dependent helicase/nuclease subunit B